MEREKIGRRKSWKKFLDKDIKAPLVAEYHVHSVVDGLLFKTPFLAPDESCFVKFDGKFFDARLQVRFLVLEIFHSLFQGFFFVESLDVVVIDIDDLLDESLELGDPQLIVEQSTDAEVLVIIPFIDDHGREFRGDDAERQPQIFSFANFLVSIA